MGKNIHLRDDQVDLLESLLAATRTAITEYGITRGVENACINFCARRIDEIRALLQSPKPPEKPDGDLPSTSHKPVHRSNNDERATKQS